MQEFAAQFAKAWRVSSRWLPQGWLDALRQLALFAGAYYAYRIVRGLVDGQAALAFENARTLVDAERTMGLFFEPGLQAWAQGEDWIVTGANWMYVNSHFVVTTTFLIWLYIARNHAYYYVRNMFMIAMGLALVGYLAYPTAPPRYMPEWGFTDTVATFVGDAAEQSANVLYNPFAAVPSMHVAFALMIANPGDQAGEDAGAEGRLGAVPRAGHVRRGRDRQPLLARRRARRAGGRDLRRGRLIRARPRPPRRMGVADGPPRSRGVVSRAMAEPAQGRLTAAEMRVVARNRLIESRLTPNAISMAGLVGTSSPRSSSPRASSSSPGWRSSRGR